MFTYVCLGTNDIAKAADFYDAVMGALGLSRCLVEGDANFNGWLGWGPDKTGGEASWSLRICAPFDRQPAAPGNGVMVALRAQSWLQVQVFYAAALAHGGTSEGEPGLRPQYGEHFYAAYVRDPDGNKLAAVCREAQPSEAPVEGDSQPVG
ncbi:catechol 2,3-dioxygenase-like lactoylglutathione lyase family enzyme [Hydrogenophaga palleronii]|uniref:Catechol 2,3-dioxygenase-like lactoylglutathione lyase family enzyme n=1 Tax=Hydrogenophaga palleronii TaxID=65655 RepID=A0ABU1WP11_9BURK|nr:VOC family protein [Hydrogenophaga palleronii]MDR7150662.1 catechol 2,3-dioxygenase-like lactoylglutathione lyase family enzyme [Hydrogenophaga palleronii]